MKNRYTKYEQETIISYNRHEDNIFLNLALKAYNEDYFYTGHNDTYGQKLIGIKPPYRTKLLSDDGSEDYLDEERIKKLMTGYDVLIKPNYKDKTKKSKGSNIKVPFANLTEAPQDALEKYMDFTSKKGQAKKRAKELTYNHSEFIDLVNNDNSLVINDYVIHLAIRDLQQDVCSLDQERSNKARETLKKAKLSLFVPKIPKKPTRYFTLKLLKEDPIRLYIWVQYLNQKISEFYKPPYTSEPRGNLRHITEEKEDIKKAYEIVYGKKMPAGFEFKELSNHTNAISFTFLSDIFNIGYATLRKLYYDNAKDIESKLDELSDELLPLYEDKDIDIIDPSKHSLIIGLETSFKNHK